MLVVLLGISIAAAAIAPDRGRRLIAVPESTTTTEAPAGSQNSGGVVSAEIEASAEKPQTVRAAVGDRLVLSVGSPQAIQVEIPPLGLLADADELVPAQFDVLLHEPGMLPIVDAESEQVIGRIIVAARHENAGRPRGRGPGGEGIGPQPVPQSVQPA